jgi:hypothetical protein
MILMRKILDFILLVVKDDHIYKIQAEKKSANKNNQ